MKTILGLDLGTTSIGWALVKEAEPFSDEKSEIVRPVYVSFPLQWMKERVLKMAKALPQMPLGLKNVECDEISKGIN